MQSMHTTCNYHMVFLMTACTQSETTICLTDSAMTTVSIVYPYTTDYPRGATLLFFQGYTVE